MNNRKTFLSTLDLVHHCAHHCSTSFRWKCTCQSSGAVQKETNLFSSHISIWCGAYASLLDRQSLQQNRIYFSRLIKLFLRRVGPRQPSPEKAAGQICSWRQPEIAVNPLLRQYQKAWCDSLSLAQTDPAQTTEPGVMTRAATCETKTLLFYTRHHQSLQVHSSLGKQRFITLASFIFSSSFHHTHVCLAAYRSS